VRPADCPAVSEAQHRKVLRFFFCNAQITKTNCVSSNRVMHSFAVSAQKFATPFHQARRIGK
jgi:hypothetical protein